MFPNNKVFDINEMDDYFVNGSPTKSSITPLQNVTNVIQLNTRGLPPPINIGGPIVIAGFGEATQQPSTSQRLNVQTKKVDKSWKKNIPHMVINNNCLVAHDVEINIHACMFISTSSQLIMNLLSRQVSPATILILSKTGSIVPIIQL